MPNQDPKFLQIYFMGDETEQVNIRCHYNRIKEITERAIVASLETMLNERNQLIQLFKHTSERMQSDNYMVVIKADKIPAGQHAGRFNAPTINEVAIVIAVSYTHLDVYKRQVLASYDLFPSWELYDIHI